MAVDSDGNVGLGPSLVLDAAGNPVIAYFDVDTFALKLAHCDTPTCAAHGEPTAPPASGGGHHGAPQLAATGARTGLIVGAAGMLLVIGAALWLFGRQRSTRRGSRGSARG